MWSYQTPGRKQLRWAQRHTLVIYKTRLQNLVLYSWVKKNNKWRTAVITKSTNSAEGSEIYTEFIS